MKTPSIDNLKDALRHELCNDCGQRQAEDKTPRQVSSGCEEDCTLFTNLPRLAKVAEQGEPPCGYEVFAKALEPFSGQKKRVDVAHALTILESASVETNKSKP